MGTQPYALAFILCLKVGVALAGGGRVFYTLPVMATQQVLHPGFAGEFMVDFLCRACSNLIYGLSVVNISKSEL